MTYSVELWDETARVRFEPKIILPGQFAEVIDEQSGVKVARVFHKQSPNSRVAACVEAREYDEKFHETLLATPYQYNLEADQPSSPFGIIDEMSGVYALATLQTATA